MANHTYTLAQLTAEVEFAAGGTLDARMTAANVINDALSWLADYHPWTWLRKALSLSLVNAQNYVALPADFKRLLAIVRNSTLDALIPVTIEDIHQWRASPLTSHALTISYAISITAQLTATAAPLYRLELYPTPTAAATGAIIGTYLKIVPFLTGSTSVPDIPAPWHTSLKWLCRAFAKSDQMDEPAAGPDMERAMAELAKLIDIDGAGQGSLGKLKGAVGLIRGHRSISGTIVPRP